MHLFLPVMSDIFTLNENSSYNLQLAKGWTSPCIDET